MKKILSLLLSAFFILTLSGQELDMDYLKNYKVRSIGPAGMSGRVTSIAVENRNPAVFYIGTASGGLWKTTNKGINFAPIFDKEAVSSIGAVAISTSNEDIVWAGTGEGNPRNSLNGGYGIYKSLDGGRNWELKGLEHTRHIHRVIVHPTNPNIVYVGAIGSPWGPHAERGVYKTTDGGESWEQLLFTNQQSGVADMIMDPGNPDKLFVAMWEHHRQPWFFKSGGSGSGLYMTVDGGKNWKQMGEKDGLPKGELGRIGLAIGRGNTDYVYALVESEKTALYRSTDGGYKWEMRGTKGVVDRPFYYADIYVDPANENRVYSLFTTVNVSEDGGRTFSTLLGRQVHVDHHSWWIHPENPSFMIDGNDGGMAITYDRGKSWRHVSNLPVSQFYHIRADNDLPYHVYGGMQDNGSWKGPAYEWSRGGLVNTYWEFLMGGDGFDVVPVPGVENSVYAMAQQGHLYRVNSENGSGLSIRPAGTAEEALRFHWNSGIAQDPFDPSTVYFGSQYLHKSTDKGESWTLISPDLTSNDKEKQNFNRSGGLTYDVTGAEIYGSILAIEPSALKEGIIWVGTDDGQVQLSRDAGKSWTLLTGRIKGFPAGGWVPQIVSSPYDEAEAWVLVNNYRLNDYEPYLFHTKDFGKKWERVVGPGKVKGYALSFAQDPVEPQLQFLGTEQGLWVSIDGGAVWTKWTVSYPTVPTMDMVIQPREHDLVIGTFGRAAYVMDDLRPLRALAKDNSGVKNAVLYPVDSPEAYLANTKNPPGYYFTGDAYFKGENRASGARLSYFAKIDSSSEKKDSVTIRILDSNQKEVRSLKSVPVNGLNLVNWGLSQKGVRVNYNLKEDKPGKDEPGGGGLVLPGTYTIHYSFKGESAFSSLEVLPDPRMVYDMEGMKIKRAQVDTLLIKMEELSASLKLLRSCRKTMDMVKTLAKDKYVGDIKTMGDTVGTVLSKLEEEFLRDENIQGIFYPSDAFFVQMSEANNIIYATEPLTPNQEDQLVIVHELADDLIDHVNVFIEGPWKDYREAVENANLSLFKD